MESLYDWLWLRTRQSLPLAIGLTALNATLYTLTFMALMSAFNSIKNGDSLYPQFLVFLLLLAIIWTNRTIAARNVYSVIEDISTQVRVRICARVLALPLTEFEASNRHTAYLALTQVPRLVTEGAFMLERACLMVFAQLSGIIIVLLFFSTQPLVQLVYAATIVIAVGAGCIAVIGRSGSQSVFSDQIETAFADLVDGFKEVRLDPQLQHRLLNEVIERRVDASAEGRRVIERNAGFAFVSLDMLAVAAIGALALVSVTTASTGSDQQLRFAFFAALLPASLLFELPNFMRLSSTVRAVRELLFDLESRSAATPPWEQASPPPHRPMKLRQGLDVRDLAFTYPAREGVPGFGIGPISFTVPAGTMTFFTGGNGSGKSTAMKTLLGLYRRQQGRVIVDGIDLPPLEDTRLLLRHLHRLPPLRALLWLPPHRRRPCQQPPGGIPDRPQNPL